MRYYNKKIQIIKNRNRKENTIMKKLVFIVISLFLITKITNGQDTIHVNTQDDPFLIEMNILIELWENPYIVWEETSEGKQVTVYDITQSHTGIIIKDLNVPSTVDNARKIFDSNIRITDREGNDIIQKDKDIDLAPLLYILKYAPAYRYNDQTKMYVPLKNHSTNTVIINDQVW